MITFKTTELKIRATKINTILTATHPLISGATELQFEVITKWLDSASRIFVHSHKAPPQRNGIRPIFSKKYEIPVAEILRQYVVQIPGNEVFALAAPNVLISKTQEAFFAHVEKQKMERAWAAHAGGEVPKLFIISAPVLPHILRDMPQDLTFGNEKWAIWLHNWLRRFMLQHRYFSADQFNMASILEHKEPETTNSATISSPVAPVSTGKIPVLEAVSLTMPAMKKPVGRPKKNA